MEFLSEIFYPIALAAIFLIVFFGFFFLVGMVANQLLNQYYYYFWEIVGFGMWITILTLICCAALWCFGKLLVIATQSHLGI